MDQRQPLGAKRPAQDFYYADAPPPKRMVTATDDVFVDERSTRPPSSINSLCHSSIASLTEHMPADDIGRLYLCGSRRLNRKLETEVRLFHMAVRPTPRYKPYFSWAPIVSVFKNLKSFSIREGSGATKALYTQPERIADVPTTLESLNIRLNTSIYSDAPTLSHLQCLRTLTIFFPVISTSFVEPILASLVNHASLTKLTVSSSAYESKSKSFDIPLLPPHLTYLELGVTIFLPHPKDKALRQAAHHPFPPNLGTLILPRNNTNAYPFDVLPPKLTKLRFLGTLVRVTTEDMLKLPRGLIHFDTEIRLTYNDDELGEEFANALPRNLKTLKFGDMLPTDIIPFLPKSITDMDLQSQSHIPPNIALLRVLPDTPYPLLANLRTLGFSQPYARGMADVSSFRMSHQRHVTKEAVLRQLQHLPLKMLIMVETCQPLEHVTLPKSLKTLIIRLGDCNEEQARFLAEQLPPRLTCLEITDVSTKYGGESERCTSKPDHVCCARMSAKTWPSSLFLLKIAIPVTWDLLSHHNLINLGRLKIVMKVLDPRIVLDLPKSLLIFKVCATSIVAEKEGEELPLSTFLTRLPPSLERLSIKTDSACCFKDENLAGLPRGLFDLSLPASPDLTNKGLDYLPRGLLSYKIDGIEKGWFINRYLKRRW